jgi:hypothetical protein
MTETPNEPSTAQPDEGQGDPVDPVQEGAPATGPEAPVPPGGSDDADSPETP